MKLSTMTSKTIQKNNDSKKLPYWWDDKPQDFSPVEFQKGVASLFFTICGMLGDGELSEIRSDVMPKILTALVTHEEFSSWNVGTKQRVIESWRNLDFVLEVIEKHFIAMKSEDESFYEQFLNSLQIPEIFTNQISP